jgi:hypothetical protein
MKKLSLFLLIFICNFLYAQNPDGKNISLHVTPLWMWGNSNFQRTTTVFYPQGMANPEQYIPYNNYGVVNYPIAFGFRTQVKIPAASFLTLTLSYSYDQKFEEEDRSYLQHTQFSEYNSINGMFQTASFTVSVYNLFSVYQGD